MQLDTAFSDHHLTLDTLQGFGAVIRSLRRVCEDDELRFWSFIAFVSEHHPEILRVNLPAESATRCSEVLSRASPPPVVVRESPEGRMLRGFEDEADDG